MTSSWSASFRRIGSSLRGAWNEDSKILTLLLGFVLAVRVITMKTVHNPDAVQKWKFARDLLDGHMPSAAAFNHHAARWAINLPIALSRWLFGDSALVYYLPIFFFCLVQAFFAYRIGVLLGGARVGVLAVVMYSLIPKMGYLGSQLMPAVFESAYVLGALYCVLRSVPSQGTKSMATMGWLLASLAFSCLGYLSKVTSAFYLPGILVAVLLLHRSIALPFAYGAGFLGFIGLETWGYRQWFGYEAGRVTIITRHHLGHSKLQKPLESVWDLFERYADLSSGFSLLFFAGLLISLCLAWRFRRLAKWPARNVALAVLLTTWGFFFFSTFALKSLHPPRLAQPLNDRYLYSAAPLLAILVATGIARVVALRPVLFETLRGPVRRTAASLLLVSTYVGVTHCEGVHNPVLVKVARYESELRKAFDRGVPIYSFDEKRYAIDAARYCFLRPAQVRQAAFSYPHINGRKSRFLVNRKHKEFQARGGKVSSKKMREWQGKRGVEVTSEEGPFVVRSRKVPAPPRKKKRANKKK